jgi:hypothetical protein
MKKVLTLVAVAGMFAFYACGPSAEEKAAAEKRTQDSIQAAHEADSLAAAQVAADADKARQDSMMQADAEKAKADSMAAAQDKGKGGKK